MTDFSTLATAPGDSSAIDDGLVVNRVAQSALVTLDLATLLDAPAVAAFDLAPHLYRGLVLRERDFRAALAALDVEAFAGRDVAVFCSTDALVPTWAYLLVAAGLAPVAASVTAGDVADAERARWSVALAGHDWTAYADRPVVVKGCGTDRVPLDAFVQATRHLQGVAAKVLYGEPCSSVPVWRRPAATPAARPAGTGPRSAGLPAALPPRRPAVSPVKTLALLLAGLSALAVPAAAQTPAPAGGTPRSSTATSAAPTEGAPSSDGPLSTAPDAAPGRPSRPDLGPTDEARPTGNATEGPAVTAAPQPERLNAAVTALVEGVWELEAVSELPAASEEIVFARFVFAGDEMTTTTVYIDPDDGDLAGRSRRDRFFAADGQLLVRDGFRTRVLDVQPDAESRDRMTVRDVQERITMVLHRADAGVARDPGLYGAWRATSGMDGPLTIAFGADGRAVGTEEDDPFDVDYVVAGAYVIVDNRDTFRYTVSGDHLVLERGDELILLTRASP